MTIKLTAHLGAAGITAAGCNHVCCPLMLMPVPGHFTHRMQAPATLAARAIVVAVHWR